MWHETLDNYERKLAKARGHQRHARRADQRRIRRALRKNSDVRKMGISKYEKWVNRNHNSSHSYRYAYKAARADKAYYGQGPR